MPWPYSYRRYSGVPFPPYRFIPGKSPHPTEDPKGHSFGKKEEPEAWHSPEEWPQNTAYLYGVDLYNHGYWWEAHEAWESLWRRPQANILTKKFLKGLIKISAAFLKWHLHQQRGMEELYNDGLMLLKDVLQEHEVYMGIDLNQHITALSRHFMQVVADTESWPEPLENYPFIVLQKDITMSKS